MLYPKLNERRDVYSLNGVWQFKTVNPGYIPLEPVDDCMPMAVPSSMNEIVTDKKIKEHVGEVLYEKTFSLPVQEGKIYRLRIGATSHRCRVYLNGEYIGSGINGFYPVDLELKNLTHTNRLSVVIDNRCTFDTLPVGRVTNGRQEINYDFYNFTGIHRDVVVYSLPEKHIDDIVIKTVVDGDYSKVKAYVSGNFEKATLTVLDRDRKVVATSDTEDLIIENPQLWSCETPNLYTLAVRTEEDYYEERFGIRKIEVKGDEFLLNGKPVYFKGFGMHEDFSIVGKGNCTPVTLRNFECMKWIGANSFRTTHYPYSEELMDLADEYGYMVIDEVPAVGMNWWDEGDFTPSTVNEDTKKIHKELISLLYQRDKNHPCVVMYSVGNEPSTDEEEGAKYFEDIISYTRGVITDMPLTIVEWSVFDINKIKPMVDVLCLNRYIAWYSNHARIDIIYDTLKNELVKYHDLYKCPVVITEFGADTVEGNHSLPSESFSEEFQVEYLDENCKVFDELDFVIGEHVWNLADFKTKQGLTRVRGNRKGVFTRDRQPKLAAHFLRKRWESK